MDWFYANVATTNTKNDGGKISNMIKNINQMDFYEELKAFAEKFPMCYIEAWTPEDFAMMKYKDKLSEEDELDLDWSENEWIDVADKLYDTFDANHGTNWHKVFHIVESTTCQH